jgi:hypothetical protein
MGADKMDIIKAVNESVKELRKHIEQHHCLVASVLTEERDGDALRKAMDLCPSRSRELLLKGAIKEAIEVLEESRKAFKSKKLEVLRKKLTRILIDTG